MLRVPRMNPARRSKHQRPRAVRLYRRQPVRGLDSDFRRDFLVRPFDFVDRGLEIDFRQIGMRRDAGQAHPYQRHVVRVLLPLLIYIREISIPGLQRSDNRRVISPFVEILLRFYCAEVDRR